MGYEYYLCKPSDSTVFELGKGYLADAFERMPGAYVHQRYGYRSVTVRLGPGDVAQLAESLLATFTEDGWALDDADGGAAEYADWVASHICEWAAGEEVVYVGESHPWIDNDDTSYRDGRLRIRGTRYR